MHYRLIIATLMVLFSIISHSSEITLRLCYTDSGAFPYQVGDGREVNDPPGIAIDIIQAAADSLELKTEYIRVPDKRVLVELKKGSVDGAFIQSFQEKRMTYVKYPRKDGKLDTNRRIAVLSYYLYTLAEHSLHWDGELLSGLSDGKIGVIRGYSIIDKFKKMNVPIIEVDRSEQLFRMLKMKRVSGVAIQNLIAANYLSNNTDFGVKMVDIPLKTKNYYLMLSHEFVLKYPKISEKLWTKISEIRDEMTAEYAKKYMGNN